MWTVVQDTRKFVNEMMQRKPPLLAVDTETHYREELAGVTVTRYPAGNPNNVPFGCSMAIGDEGWWITEDLHLLRPILECEEITKIFHNYKYDGHMFKNIGIDVKGHIWDTMLMIHLINEEQFCRQPDGPPKKTKRLKDLAYHFLGADGHKYEDGINEVKKELAKEQGIAPSEVSYKAISDAAPQVMADYAISDTVFTYKLFELFLPRLEAQNLQEAYNRDLAALHAVFNMERTGLKVDIAGLEAYKKEMSTEIVRLQNHIHSIAGKVFNINADKELVSAFEGLGLTWRWYTDKDNYSTNKAVMKSIRGTHGKYDKDEDTYTDFDTIGDLAHSVLQYRKTTKDTSTFVDGLLHFSDPYGRVHSDFNICPQDNGKGSTVTGRLSSSNPNFQNLPKKDKTIRKFIIPEKDYILVEMDYKQQEYRLLAHYSQDEGLIHAIEQGWDIHQATAALLNHIPYEAVTKKQRQDAKGVNFGLVYGLGLAAFAVSLGFKIDDPLYNKGMFYLRDKNIKPWNATPLMAATLYPDDPAAQAAILYYFSEEANSAIAQAKQVKEDYFKRFPKVQDFLSQVIEVTKSRGYVRYWTGRRRHFINPKQEAYKGPNSLIQGGCGEITKEKLANCDAVLKDKKSRTVNTIHDSIKFEVHVSELSLIEQLRDILDDNNFRAPITCDVEWGLNWKDMKEFTSVDDIRRELDDTGNIL